MLLSYFEDQYVPEEMLTMLSTLQIEDIEKDPYEKLNQSNSIYLNCKQGQKFNKMYNLVMGRHSNNQTDQIEIIREEDENDNDTEEDKKESHIENYRFTLNNAQNIQNQSEEYSGSFNDRKIDTIQSNSQQIKTSKQ